jgi:TetR/AcrR family transcriptional regulator
MSGQPHRSVAPCVSLFMKVHYYFMAETYHKPTFDRIDPAKRARLLAVATAEFAARGFTSANINEIARKAEVSVGALYKYFATKEDLFLTVVNEGAETVEEVITSVVDSPGGFFEKVENILKIILSYSREYPDQVNLYNEMTSEGNAELGKKLSGRMESISAEYYPKLIAKAKKEGEISPSVDEKAFAFCLDNLFVMLQFSYSSVYYRERMRLYLGEDVFDRDEYVIGDMMKFIRGAFSRGSP